MPSTIRFALWLFLLCLTFGLAEKTKHKTEDLELHETCNNVVRNLIKKWESPVVYLIGRGFLPRDYEDTSKVKPNMDALIQRMERDKRGKTKRKSATEELHISRSPKKKHATAPSEDKRELKGLMLPNLQLLMAKDPKLKPLNDDQDMQLWAIKQRLEKLMANNVVTEQAGGNRQGILGQDLTHEAPDLSKPAYDDTLQQMMNRASPTSKYDNNPSPIGIYIPDPIVKEEKPASPEILSPSEFTNPIKSLDIFKGADKTVKEDAKTPIPDPGLQAPNYLNWDVKNGRLDNFSAMAKEAYLNQLVKMFGEKVLSKQILPNSKLT